MADEPTLETLRQQLDVLDERFFGLVAERKSIVSKIAGVKATQQKAVFDREREKDVVQSHLRHAKEAGLSSEVGQSVSRTLLAASHRLQGRSLQKSTETKRILLVGGKGGMGRLLGRLFEDRGHFRKSGYKNKK